MKRMNKVILIILSIIVVVSFFGCKKEIEQTADIPVIKVTNAAVKFAYDQANKVYAEMAYGTLPVDMSDSAIDDSGMEVHRVKYNNIKSFDDLQLYLETFFSKPLATEIIDKTQRSAIKVINGKLYTGAADRGSNIYYGDETYTYTNVNDYKIIMHVKVEYSEEPWSGKFNEYKTFDFVYENLDGKKWVFTAFPFFL